MVKMHSIFIFGFLPYSSGKTVVSTALARGLLNRGVRVGVFKPRSGHSMWYQYDAFLKCKSEGKLFCEDIIKLKEASKCSLPYEILNPIDALMSPLNLETFLKLNLVDWMYTFEREVFNHLLVERYTMIRSGEIINTLLLNEVNLREKLVLRDEEYIDNLSKSMNKVIPIHNVNEWNSYYEKLASKSICSCYSKLKEKYETLIIEGFNDAIVPELKLIYETEIVIGVSPSTAILYEANEFKRVIDGLISLGSNAKTLRSKDIIKFTRKYEILKIPPLSDKDLKDYDTLALKLEKLVDEILLHLK